MVFNTRQVSSTKGFKKGNANRNLYIKVDQDNILIIDVYVYENIFGSNDNMMCRKFSKDMQNEFKMNLLSEFNFFFGLQICQCDKGIFISQTKYIR
jgi:hypothetical protein